MSGTAELTYFDGRGLTEIVRIVLTAAEIKFSEVDLQTREDFLALQPDLLFRQVPLLRIDGMNLVQSGAIVRYLARKANLLGQTEQETARIDMLYEGSRDFYRPCYGIGFLIELNEVKEKFTPNVDKYLPIFSKVLKENGSSGFLVGNSLSLADLGLLEAVLVTIDYCGKEAFDSYPEIQGFYKKMSSLDFYERYIKDIRKPCNSPEYLSNVKKILQF